MSREVISNGNSLVAKAAVDVGCKFFAGYPITPSSEIMEHMGVDLPKVGGHFIQMEDEIGSIAAAIGASMSGVKSMTGSSGPGISLKSEQIGYSFITEVPLVIANVMRGGPSTGLPTRVSQSDLGQAKYPSHGDYESIAIYPGSLEECYTETIRAFNLSEELMTPVFLLSDETLGHMYGKAVLPDLEDIEIVDRKKYTGDKKTYAPYDVPMNEPAVLNPFFEGYKYHITGLHHGPTGFPTEDAKQSQFNIDRLCGKIRSRRDEIATYEEYMLDDAEICIVAYGSISRSAKEAIGKLRADGIKAGLWRPITIWPSADKRIAEIGRKFDKMVVVELNVTDQYFGEIERITKKDNLEKLQKANGRPVAPLEIVKKVKEMM